MPSHTQSREHHDFHVALASYKPPPVCPLIIDTVLCICIATHAHQIEMIVVCYEVNTGNIGEYASGRQLHTIFRGPRILSGSCRQLVDARRNPRKEWIGHCSACRAQPTGFSRGAQGGLAARLKRFVFPRTYCTGRQGRKERFLKCGRTSNI